MDPKLINFTTRIIAGEDLHAGDLLVSQYDETTECWHALRWRSGYRGPLGVAASDHKRGDAVQAIKHTVTAMTVRVDHPDWMAATFAGRMNEDGTVTIGGEDGLSGR